MKRVLRYLGATLALAATLLLPSLSAPAGALSLAEDPATAPENSSLANMFGGQKQYYALQLRSDKKALVYAKIIFENSEGEEKKQLKLKLPQEVQVNDLAILQVLAKGGSRNCSAYETLEEWTTRNNYSPSSVKNNISYYQDLYQKQRICITYNDNAYDEDFDFDSNISSGGDYYSPYYYSRRDTKQFEYKELKVDNQDNTLTVTLENPVKTNKQGAVLVSYTSPSYIQGALGRFTYDFKTFIASERVENVTVAINFDEELYSRTAKQKRETSKDINLGSVEGASGSNAISSPTIDNTWYNITSGGRYIKSQGNMIPGDTLEIKGVFATNKALLYIKEIIITIIVLAILGSSGWFLRKKLQQKKAKEINKSKEREIKNDSPKELGTESPIFTNFVDLGHFGLRQKILLSTISLLGTGFVTFIQVCALSFFSLFDTGYSGSAVNALSPLLYITLIIITAVFGLILIPLNKAKEYGHKQAQSWMVTHVLFMVVLLYLLAFSQFIIFGSDGYIGGNDLAQ